MLLPNTLLRLLPPRALGILCSLLGRVGYCVDKRSKLIAGVAQNVADLCQRALS